MWPGKKFEGHDRSNPYCIGNDSCELDSGGSGNSNFIDSNVFLLPNKLPAS